MRVPRDAGSASVVLMAMGLAAIVLGVTIASAGSMLVADHRAGSVADLSALAAATQAVRGEGVACGLAHRVADDQRVQLRSCHLDGLDAVVTVQATVPIASLGGPGSVIATARAGPVEL